VQRSSAQGWLEIIERQPVGQFAGIDLVAFVAMFEWSVLARVAHH
jgi:hypothetical protein